MSFTLCLNTSTIKPQKLIDKIRLAAEAGYQGVEIWINDIYEHVGRGGEVRDIEQALSDSGLIVPATIALRQWGEAVGLEYKLSMEEARRRMEIAARIGAPYVVATPPREPCETGQLVDRYGELLRIGREVGICPTFEYISFFGSVSRLDHAWEIVKAANDPDATLILDAFHTWNSGGTLDDLRRIPANRISHYHINDAAPDKPKGSQIDPDRVMIGDGPIDLAAEIEVLREIGYDRTISLELFNADLWNRNPKDVVKQGIERLRALTGMN